MMVTMLTNTPAALLAVTYEPVSWCVMDKVPMRSIPLMVQKTMPIHQNAFASF